MARKLSVSFSLSASLVEALDVIAPGSRSSFVEGVLEQALGSRTGGGIAGPVRASVEPTSRRQVPVLAKHVVERLDPALVPGVSRGAPKDAAAFKPRPKS